MEQAPRLAHALESGASQQQVEELVRTTAQSTESRVTLLAVRDDSGGPVPSFVVADSQAEATAIQGRYLTADAAIADGHVASGVEHVAGTRVGTSAVPIDFDGQTRWVAVLSTPLAEVNDDVALVRRQILIAGLIALVAASLIGFWASGAVSRRLRRMRAGGGGRRRGPLRPADPGRLLRRARPARPQLQRDAAAPRAPRQLAQGVHRQRLARAAHADLLPGRLRRAARDREADRRRAPGIRRGDARRRSSGCRSSPSTCSTSRASTRTWSRSSGSRST